MSKNGVSFLVSLQPGQLLFGIKKDSSLLISLFLSCWLIVPPPFFPTSIPPLLSRRLLFPFSASVSFHSEDSVFCAPNGVGGGLPLEN